MIRIEHQCEAVVLLSDHSRFYWDQDAGPPRKLKGNARNAWPSVGHAWYKDTQ